jgi:hypothetical protein
MKTAGIILLVLGILSTLGMLIAASQGQKASFGSVAFIVLGAFLISRANKNKEDEEKKKKWESGSVKNE